MRRHWQTICFVLLWIALTAATVYLVMVARQVNARLDRLEHMIREHPEYLRERR